MDHNQPTCHIVAGPNGAGKSTFARSYIFNYIGEGKYLNADDIAKALCPEDPSKVQARAGKIFLGELERQIELREDFAFETTLAGFGFLSKILRWREDNWNVVLYYLYIPSPNFSLQRVKERVSRGGHDIPEKDIFRRYPRSLANLFTYSNVCDMTLCFDNSGAGMVPIFERMLGGECNVMDAELYAEIERYLREQKEQEKQGDTVVVADATASSEKKEEQQ